MGHHTQDITSCAKHASDVPRGTIDVFGIAEGDATIPFKSVERIAIREIIAIMMCNGDADLFTIGVAAGKRRLAIFDRQGDGAADEPYAGIAH